MIEVQMRLYKNDGVTSQYLCFFFGECTEVAYITYTMATRNSPDTYACGPRAWACISGKSFVAMDGKTITHDTQGVSGLNI